MSLWRTLHSLSDYSYLSRVSSLCRGYPNLRSVSKSAESIHIWQGYPSYPSRVYVAGIPIHWGYQGSLQKRHPVDRIQFLRLIAFGFKCRWSSLLFPTDWPVIGCFYLHDTIIGSCWWNWSSPNWETQRVHIFYFSMYFAGWGHQIVTNQPLLDAITSCWCGWTGWCY